MSHTPSDRPDTDRSTAKRRRLLQEISESSNTTPLSTDRSEAEISTIDRRRLLQGIAATGLAVSAGCLGGDDEGDDESDDTGTDPDDPEPGRLEFAIERSGIDEYDQAESSLSDDSTVFNVVYDGLLEQNTEGEVFLWMAEEYETTDAQDIDPIDYEEYMGEYEIQEVDEGFPVLDLEWPNLVLIYHPEDMTAIGEGELGEGDDIRVLTREESGDAAADGAYGTRIVGRLHEGIEFHNGEECTAENIVRSYDRFVGSDNQGQVFNSFLHAEATDGPDGYEFELYAQEADAIAEVSLPPTQIYPSDHFEVRPGDLEPREDGPVPIGTGPYEIAEFEEGSQLLLKKTDNYWLESVGLENKDWWDGPEDFPEAPVIDEINVRFVPEGGQRVAGLQDGSIDIAYQLPASDRTTFDEDDDYTVGQATSTGFNFMQFPVEDTDEGGAFAHREVRQAVSHLIPRQDIVEIVSDGWGTPAQVPFPEPAAGIGSTMTYEELGEQDWAYPLDPDLERAEELIEESPLEAPIEMVIETNADDEERQDKMALLVDELNQSGLFEATLETPAEIGDWTTQNLYDEDANTTYAERNATAMLGLGGGFDPHGYAEAIHDPDNYNICCNFFFPEGTFDFIDELRSCRFGEAVAEDPELRAERYDELWETLATEGANTMVDFSLETVVAGPDVEGYVGYPDRRMFLSYSLHAPYDEQYTSLNR